MTNGIFKLGLGNVTNAVLMAIATAVLVAIYGIVSTAGFDVFTANWAMIGKQMVNLGVVVGIGSLYRDLISTTQGSILNIGPKN